MAWSLNPVRAIRARRAAVVREIASALLEAQTHVTWPRGAAAYRPNSFQLGTIPGVGFPAMKSTAIYAVVSVIAQDLARLRCEHKRISDARGVQVVRGSGINAVLRRPNEYQTSSDYWLEMQMNLLLDGTAVAYTPRDQAGRVLSMHPLSPSHVQPLIKPESGAIYWRVSPPTLHPIQQVAPGGAFTVPARDLLSIRLFPSAHPLIGLSPLEAATWPVLHGRNIQQQQTELFDRRGVPDVALSFKTKVNPKYAEALAAEWKARYRTGGEGGVAILDGDANVLNLGANARDAQVVEQYRLTVFDICRIYRVPPHMAGLSEQGGPQFNNAETFSRQYFNQCLGFYLDHNALALERHFGTADDERIEFDFEGSLSRTTFAETVESLTKAVQGAVLTPNESRRRQRLEPREGGDSLYMQRQMSKIEDLEAEPVPAPAPAPAPVAPEPETEAVRAELERVRAAAGVERMQLAAELGGARADAAALRARLEEARP